MHSFDVEAGFSFNQNSFYTVSYNFNITNEFFEGNDETNKSHNFSPNSNDSFSINNFDSNLNSNSYAFTKQTNVPYFSSFSGTINDKFSSSMLYETKQTNDFLILPNSPNEPKKKGTNTITIIGVVCGVLAAIVIATVVVIILIKKRKKNDEDDNENISKNISNAETQSFKHDSDHWVEVDDEDRDLGFWL